MYKFEITDAAVIASFNRLIDFGENPRGALLAIGEQGVEFTKSRFEESKDPYDNPWAPNSDTTLRNMLHGNGKNFTKKGGLSARGNKVLAGKKPLIGDSKSLSTQLSYHVSGNSVTITSPMVYAAMQNFGGTKAEFQNLWGDIPARPFFPDEKRGLPDALNRVIGDVLRAALENAMKA